MEGDVATECTAMNLVEVDPDLGGVVLVDGVGEVELVGAAIDAIWRGRDLDRNARVDLSTLTESLDVLPAVLRDVDTMGVVIGVGDGPDIDRLKVVSISIITATTVGMEYQCEKRLRHGRRLDQPHLLACIGS